MCEIPVNEATHTNAKHISDTMATTTTTSSSTSFCCSSSIFEVADGFENSNGKLTNEYHWLLFLFSYTMDIAIEEALRLRARARATMLTSTIETSSSLKAMLVLSHKNTQVKFCFGRIIITCIQHDDLMMV